MRDIKIIGVTLLCTAVMVLSFGCKQQTRYEVLSFFFTGVPSPEEEARLKAEQERQAADGDAEAQPVFSSHSYYTARKCDACHQITLTQNFGAVRSGMPTINFGAGDTTDESRLPLKKVCVGCHENRSEAFALANDLWLHAPVNEDNCLVCHDPHRSKYPDLLKEDPGNLCYMCHSEGQIRLTEPHQDLKGCLECHNPHLGKDKNLLVKDYKEERKLPVPKPAVDGSDGENEVKE